MRLVYFGSGAFGLPTLRMLLECHDVRLVVSQPARPAGRRRQERPTPIATLAASAGIETITPERPNDPEPVARIRAVEADAYVVIAYGHKLRAALLEGVFTINLHASLLPEFRGAAPINWAVMNGAKTTGVSVITLADTMDAGAVLGVRGVTIDPMETAGELHDRLAELGPEVVAEVLDARQAGTLEPRVQDESLVTQAPKLSKADGTVSFDEPARAVQARVHGLTPWPGCTVTIDGTPLKLHRVAARDEREPDAVPGAVQADGLVACGEGSVHLLAVQPAGGKLMSFDAWRRGHRVADGARMEPL
jgi:methionyl-tRNA formyltransferase